MDNPVAPNQTTAPEQPHKSRSNVWIACIVLPFILLFVVGFIQGVARAILGGSTSEDGTARLVVLIINLLSLLVGIVSVVLLLLIPLWIILLVRETSNKA